MKKVLFIIFAIMVINLPAFASISVEETTSRNYTDKHGYSDEMARLIDLQKAQINSTEPTFKKYVWSGKDFRAPIWLTRKLPKGYSEKLENVISEKRVNYIRRIFCYFDSGLDDGDFGTNEIKFNTGFEDL